jgi:hypothetical protein
VSHIPKGGIIMKKTFKTGRTGTELGTLLLDSNIGDIGDFHVGVESGDDDSVTSTTYIIKNNLKYDQGRVTIDPDGTIHILDEKNGLDYIQSILAVNGIIIK